GRLKPGINLEQARAQLNTVARQLGQEYPKTDEGMSLRLTPPGLVDPNLRSAVIAFSGALMLTVLLVLLIACTNLASLLLARATQRRKEIAVRMAIGATRARLAWQRSEEHTSELQSPYDLVCRLLLEKKKKLTATLS